MSVVRLSREYILDNIINVCESLANPDNNNSVTLEIPPSDKPAVGMALDVISAVYLLTGSRYSVDFPDAALFPVKYNSPSYTYLIRRSAAPKAEAERSISAVHIFCGEKGIGATGRSISPEAADKLRSRRVRLFDMLSGYTPPHNPTCALKFHYSFPAGYPIDTFFYAPRAITSSNTSSRTATWYAISSEEEYELSARTFSLLATGAVWDAWGKYHANAVNILAGTQLREIAERYDSDVSRLELRLAKAMPTTLLELLGATDEFILKEIKCPTPYASLRLFKPWRSTRRYMLYNHGDKLLQGVNSLLGGDEAMLEQRGFSPENADGIMHKSRELIRRAGVNSKAVTLERLIEIANRGDSSMRA